MYQSCDFCQIEDDYLKPICCPQGMVSCADCLMTGNVNSATQCSICHQQLGKKMGSLRAEVRQMFPNFGDSLQMKYGKQKRDCNMPTQKKIKGPKNINDSYEQRGYGQGYQNYQTIPIMHHHGSQPMPYGTPYCNSWGPNYYNQMPPQMNPNRGHFVPTGWGMDYPDNYEGNGFYRENRMPVLQNQLERDTYMKMISSQRRVIPSHTHDDQQEHYTPGKHSLGTIVYPEHQNKTTQILQQSTTKNKSFKMHRSNSLNNLNNFSLRR